MLKDHGGVANAPVILFESEEAGRFADDKLFKIVTGAHGRNMSLLLDVMKPHEPSLGIARARGF